MKQQQNIFLHRFFWTTLVSFGCFLVFAVIIVYDSTSFTFGGLLYMIAALFFVAIIIGGLISAILQFFVHPTQVDSKHIQLETQELSLPYEYTVSVVKGLLRALRSYALPILFGIVLLHLHFSRFGFLILIFGLIFVASTIWISYGYRTIRFNEDGIYISKNRSNLFIPWSDIRAFYLSPMQQTKLHMSFPPMYTTLFFFIKDHNGDPYRRIPIPYAKSLSFESLFNARGIEKSHMRTWQDRHRIH